MEPSSTHGDQQTEDEEHVLLDLESVSDIVPPNAPYVLSGLDTLNPVLIIDNKHHRLKLIGHYEETVGACVVFSEKDASGEDSSQVPRKEIKPVASLTKILKFEFSSYVDIQDGTGKNSNQDLMK